MFKKISFFMIALAMTFAGAQRSRAQDPTSQPTATATPDAQQQQEEKLKQERKATALLEQLVSEAQGLRLPENRIRVQISAGDMLWNRDAARARGLFNDAGAAISQMTSDVDRTDRDDIQVLTALRRDLVLTAARHDAELGYQLLRSTQPPPVANVTVVNGRRAVNFPDQTANLEQSLLSVIATTDPKLAYQKVVELLDKGEYPSAVGRVLVQLMTKDKEAFDKLSSKVLTRLSSDNLVSSRDAGNLAIVLLRAGPRPAESSTGNSTGAASAPNANQAILTESSYHDLMDATITAALTATRPAPGSNPGFVTVVGSGPGGRGDFRPTPPGQPDAAQQTQNNARSLLMQMQMMLPQIDQYMPTRAQSVRQKLTELGMSNNQMAQLGQMSNALRQNTSEGLMAAAASAPQQIQPRLYQQAAQKAIDEGNTDRAVQIANEHLDETSRNLLIQTVDLKKMATDPTPEKLAEIRQRVAALPNDSDRVKMLIGLANLVQKDNAKLALRFLEDARILVGKRATSYRDFEDQISVADAFASIDPQRSFDVLEPGIAQLNELLAAAAILSGFEVEVFRDGELPLQNGSELGAMVTRFGYELAALAKLDFDHAKMTADRFQLAEPRLLAKLAIVQLALGGPQNQLNLRRNQGIQVFSR